MHCSKEFDASFQLLMFGLVSGNFKQAGRNWRNMKSAWRKSLKAIIAPLKH